MRQECTVQNVDVESDPKDAYTSGCGRDSDQNPRTLYADAKIQDPHISDMD